ncbi:unnamed protein product [Cuscuta campestris]|uniref:Retrotransposon gag domain-containing protein n=1 Tax=Cuscuta campestris TaxID=132261 RepID=A0A484MRF1_9ASTE|nr:unnamed protein product [Cuscuta campestris]
MYDNQPDPLVEEIIRLEQKIFYFDEVLFAEGSWYKPPYSRDYTLFAEEQIEANKVAIRRRAKLLESVRKEKEFERRLCEGSYMMQKMLDDFQRERLEAEAKADKLVNDLCKAVELKRCLQSQDQLEEVDAQKEALEPKTNLETFNHQVPILENSPKPTLLQKPESITTLARAIGVMLPEYPPSQVSTSIVIHEVKPTEGPNSKPPMLIQEKEEEVLPMDGWNLKSWDELLVSDDEDSSMGESTVVIIKPQTASQPVEDKEEINFAIKANNVDLLMRFPPPPTHTRSPPYILLPPSHRDESRILDLDLAKIQIRWYQKRVRKAKLYDSRIGKSRKKKRPTCKASKMDVAWMILHGNRRTLQNMEELPLHLEQEKKKFLTWGNTKMLQPPMVLDPTYLDELGYWQDIDDLLYDPKWRILLFLHAPASLEATIEFLCSLCFLNNEEEAKSAAEARGLHMAVLDVLPESVSMFRPLTGYLAQIAYNNEDKEARPKWQHTIPMSLHKLSQAMYAFQDFVDSCLRSIETLLLTQQWQMEEILDHIRERGMKKTEHEAGPKPSKRQGYDEDEEVHREANSSYTTREENHERGATDFKVDIPTFEGKNDPDDFLEWLETVERVFDFKDVPEDKKVKIVAFKFWKCASTWWSNLSTKRRRENKAPVKTWLKMRSLLKKKFLPKQYVRDNFAKLQHLRQGPRSVEDYTREFEELLMRCDLQ